MKIVLTLTTIALYISLIAVSAHSASGQAEKSDRRPWPMWPEKSFGRAGNPKNVSRTVYVDISDKMHLDPARSTIQRGDTVKFVIKNGGRELHEMVIGTMDDLDEHGGLMASFPGMVEHAGAYMTYVAPGKTQEIVWQFTEIGEFNFGCVIPGHSKAAEVGKIFVVSPK